MGVSTIPCMAAIDCGTTTTKCALVDLAGRMVAEAGVAAPLRATPDGRVECDAAELYDGVCRALAARKAPGVART